MQMRSDHPSNYDATDEIPFDYASMIMGDSVNGNDIGNDIGNLNEMDLADLPQHLQIDGALSNTFNGNDNGKQENDVGEEMNEMENSNGNINGNGTQNDNDNPTNNDSSSSVGDGCWDCREDPSWSCWQMSRSYYRHLSLCLSTTSTSSVSYKSSCCFFY